MNEGLRPDGARRSPGYKAGELAVRPWDNSGNSCVVRWTPPDAEGYVYPLHVGPVYDTEAETLAALAVLADLPTRTEWETALPDVAYLGALADRITETVGSSIGARLHSPALTVEIAHRLNALCGVLVDALAATGAAEAETTSPARVVAATALSEAVLDYEAMAGLLGIDLDEPDLHIADDGTPPE